MKSYAIYDEELNRETPIGYLFYYEKAEKFIVELCKDLDEWSAPLLFQGFVKKKTYTIPHTVVKLWVEERIIPSGRQNIGSILKNHKLQNYSEMALLSLSKGRCSQDHCYIAEIAGSDIPEEIRERSRANVSECFPTGDGQIICMFGDNSVRKIDLEALTKQYKDVIHVLRSRRLLDSVKVGVGGYSVVFDDSIEVQVEDLKAAGKALSLSAEDFYGFVQRNVVDATQVCDMMQCTRQNLSYLVKEEKIAPIITGSKTNLYTRGTVEHIMND